MQTIYLDISNKGVVPTIYAKQGDVGRKFEVVLTDSGLPYISTSGSAFSVWYSGTSGEGNYTEIGGKSAFSVNGNKVIVEMIAQMLSNDGEGILSLVLNDNGGNQIGLWSIRYVCESVPGANSEEAKEYYTAFSESVKKLSVESVNYPGCYYRTVNGVVEWVNPPMLPSVEYRTTERWNGEPVYTMAINFGALPNNSASTVNSIINADAEDIRIDGVLTDGTGYCRPLWALIFDAYAYCNHTSKGFATIATDRDLTAWNAKLILKYVVRK